MPSKELIRLPEGIDFVSWEVQPKVKGDKKRPAHLYDVVINVTIGPPYTSASRGMLLFHVVDASTILGKHYLKNGFPPVYVRRVITTLVAERLSMKVPAAN